MCTPPSRGVRAPPSSFYPHAPGAPLIVLRLAAAMRRALTAWVWRPGTLWYELLAIVVLSLWIGTSRAELGVMARIGFWLAVINPFLPLLLAVSTVGAWG